MGDVPPHPAKFSDNVIASIQAVLNDYNPWDWDHDDEAPWVLDAFAGVGKIHQLRHVQTVGVEIEPEWANAHERTIVGDALDLRASGFETNSVWAYVTSIVYGNRMSDHHEAKDDSVRNTYRHKLGRPLHPNNSGQLHFHQQAWKDFHHKAFAEACDVTTDLIVINIKNFYRGPSLMKPVEWVITDLIEQGCTVEEVRKVPTPGNRFGANGQRRVEFEHLVVVRPPSWIPPLSPQVTSSSPSSQSEDSIES